MPAKFKHKLPAFTEHNAFKEISTCLEQFDVSPEGDLQGVHTFNAVSL